MHYRKLEVIINKVGIGAMKEITMRVNDEMEGLIEELTKHLEGVEVVGTGELMAEEDCDTCFKEAIMELRQDGVIRRPRDYGWIMAGLEQNVIDDMEGFISPQAFIDYMNQVGLDELPCRSTLSSAYGSVDGQWPEWTFWDTEELNEILRRKNVVVRFKSAFLRAKRAKLDRKLDNCA